MYISESGIRLIKHYEALRLKSYQDSVGVWTIGWGHTPCQPNIIITQQVAEELLKTDLNRVCRAVQNLIRVPLTQGQFDALVSFTFNLGAGSLKGSTLRQRINRGDYTGASSEFKKWVYAGGRRLPGLQARRFDETVLFCSDLKSLPWG